MAKPTLDKNEEGTKLFYSIFRGNDTLNKIIIDLKYDVIFPIRKGIEHNEISHINIELRGKPKKQEKHDKRHSGKTRNNVTNKLSSLVKLNIISKNGEGKRRWTKYHVDYEGIFNFLKTKICFSTDKKSFFENINIFIYYLKDYINIVENITDFSINEILEGFIQGFNMFLDQTKRDNKTRLKIEGYDTFLINDFHINMSLLCNEYYNGVKPEIIKKSPLRHIAYNSFITCV